MKKTTIAEYQSLLAKILGAQKKWQEALKLAIPFVEEILDAPEAQSDITNFVISAAASGYANEATQVIINSKASEALEPLIIGVQIFSGDSPSVAQEIFEIGQDIAQRIHDRQDQLQIAIKTGDSHNNPVSP